MSSPSQLKHRSPTPPQNNTPLPTLTPEESLPTFTPPTFTTKELQACVPAHCFERSFFKSFSYVLWDLTLLAGLVFGVFRAQDWLKANSGKDFFGYGELAGWGVRTLVWSLYAYLAGLVGTGVWVLAHECGHQSFSDSRTANNTVGFILHTALLVPYHAWRISHGKHHTSTAHMTRDQVWVPKTRSQLGAPSIESIDAKKVAYMQSNPIPEGEKERKSWFNKVEEVCEEAPLMTLIQLIVQQLIGWQLYLIANCTSSAKYPKGTNHFNPNSELFDPRYRGQIIASDIGLMVMSGVLYFWGSVRGWQEVALVYGVPYIWVNHWLVLITYLQHTDPYIPHYRDGEWNFQRGALCTIDRNIHGFFFHGIAETHVAHHLFSKMPHYNAWEATAALKQKLGKYYLKSEENYWISLWKAARNCRFVEDEGEVLFYKDSYGRASMRPAAEGEHSDSGVDVEEK